MTHDRRSAVERVEAESAFMWGTILCGMGIAAILWVIFWWFGWLPR